MGYILLIVIAFAIYAVVARNQLIQAKNAVQRAWSDVSVYERQKVKILESLEPLLQQYVSHESEVFSNISAMRSAAGRLNADSIDVDAVEEIEANAQVVMRELYAVSENYPDIKANMVFLRNMDEIVEQNENVGAALSIYNSNTEMFNNEIAMFPKNVINNMFTKYHQLDNFTDPTTDANIAYKPNF